MAQYLDRRGKDANGSGRPGNEQLAEAAGNTVAADIEHAICPAAVEYIGDHNHTGRAGRRLARYSAKADDKNNRPQTVELDRRRFGPSYRNLPHTKTTGW